MKKIKYFACMLSFFLLLSGCSYVKVDQWLRGESTTEELLGKEPKPEGEEGAKAEAEVGIPGLPTKPHRELGEQALPSDGYYEVGETIPYSYMGRAMDYTLKSIEIVEKPDEERIKKEHFSDFSKSINDWKNKDMVMVLLTADIKNVNEEPSVEAVDEKPLWYIFPDLLIGELYYAEPCYRGGYVYGEDSYHDFYRIPLSEDGTGEIQYGWLVEKKMSNQVLYWELGSNMGKTCYYFRLGSLDELSQEK